jgi:hypothetical protein
MQPTPIALILASRLAHDEARSALPNAPVISHVDKLSLIQRTRITAAAGLRRAADIVAPARPVKRQQGHAGVRREAG